LYTYYYLKKLQERRPLGRPWNTRKYNTGIDIKEMRVQAHELES
jgi:hypothetical protein